MTQSPVVETTVPLVVNEVTDEPKVGDFVGQCKWFSDKLGYGFITVRDGEHKGKDIFVHHSGIKPLNSNYKTLKKGEYVNLNVTTGENGLVQAVDITGIGGGSLMCDVTPSIRSPTPVIAAAPPTPHSTGRHVHYRSVPRRQKTT